ncbi:hypothetical protein [Streptomyces sp. NPDC017988]|uniref:hypothetical protein n=1 Tax=Streptomyces sp. NPDC017988 TaxID=3365025 RepID=UPI0037A032AC
MGVHSPQSGLPDEHLWVAGELRYLAGRVLPCSATPVVAGMYERVGRAPGIGSLRLTEHTRPSGVQAALAELFGDGDEEVGLAVAARTSGLHRPP